MADAGGNGGSVRARSGLSQAETGVQARALVVALVTAAAVAVGGGRGWETQGFGRGFARGGGNMK